MPIKWSVFSTLFKLQSEQIPAVLDKKAFKSSIPHLPFKMRLVGHDWNFCTYSDIALY